MNYQNDYAVEDDGPPIGVRVALVVVLDAFVFLGHFVLYDMSFPDFGQSHFLADAPLVGLIFDRPGWEDATVSTLLAFMLSGYTVGASMVFWNHALNTNFLDDKDGYYADKRKYLMKIIIKSAYIGSILVEGFFLIVRVATNNKNINSPIPLPNAGTETWELWLVAIVVVFVNLLIGVFTARVLGAIKEKRK